MPVISFKPYACSECGYTKQIDTNHHGSCWSAGNYNKCPTCTFKRANTNTTWWCLEPEPNQFITYKEAKLAQFLSEG